MPPGSGRAASTLSAPPSSMPGARSKAHPPRMLCSSTSTWLPPYGIETLLPLTALNAAWSLDRAVNGNETAMSGLLAFDRYIGIDYSGAETPISSLKGVRVYTADHNGPPTEVPPPPSPRKYWTRREIAEWLVERLAEKQPTLVGIDHGFSFPMRYFDEHHLPHDWPAFLDDFQRR